jgi:uracil-DNA glycosylase
MNKKEKIDKIYSDLESTFDENQVFVPGEGNLDCTLMLIGEAPGAKETELKRPFVGKAGNNLDEFLKVIHLERKDIYISNVVKFRPYKIHPTKATKSNRTPTRQEINQCISALEQEILTIKPKIIVTLGNTALKAVLCDKTITIGSCHGTVIPYKNDIFLFALYHPASIIYNRSLANVYNMDLQKLYSILTKI